MKRSYGGFDFRYDSPGCTALGVQAGTDYIQAFRTRCPNVYSYGYHDSSATFQCNATAPLLIQACPDAAVFPSE